MRSTVLLAACLLVTGVTAPAQICGAGQTLLKNDNLAAVPSGSTTVSVIQGLCEGEACAAVFDVSSLGTSVQLHDATVGLFSGGGAAGNTAAIDLEVYDGITWNGQTPVLGPLVFSYQSATGGNLQASSHGINTTPLSSFNIKVTSGTMVVAWRMLLNFNGTCAGGYTTNFGTDNTTFQFVCTPTITPARKNLIFITGQGWRDASNATVTGIPLCPFFYSGNWVIRACVEGTTCTPPLTLAQGTPGKGGLVPTIGTSGGAAQIGNAGFALKIGNTVGVTPGILLLNVVETPVPFAGGTVFVLPGIAVNFFLGGIPSQAGGGNATIPLPIPAVPALAGGTFTTQAGVLDAAAIQSIALTAGLRVTICP